jgi:DNA-directed RNA polymerase subunit RPC12/RpoP
MNCPHCGSQTLYHYRDAFVRHDVHEIRSDRIVLEGASRTVLQYDDEDVRCPNCDKRIDVPAVRTEFTSPRLKLDPEAVRAGFASTYGAGDPSPLAALPGGGGESFGEFAEAVVLIAAAEWKGITGPEWISVRLMPVFPYGQRLCPLLQVAGREEMIAAPTIDRSDLELSDEVRLGQRSATTALVLCGCAVDAANESLSKPSLFAEFDSN